MIKRSECRCPCHLGRGAVHVVACCEPDSIFEQFIDTDGAMERELIRLRQENFQLRAERDRWYARMHKLELQIETIRKTIGP